MDQALRLPLLLAALSGAVAVGAGAFGAHGAASEQAKAWLQTGGMYQLVHAVAAVAAVLAVRQGLPAAGWAAWLFLVGAAVFSGALYGLGFGGPRVLGAVEIDHAYTALERTPDGFATVRLSDPSGTGVEMTWDAACPWVQVHTADLPGGAAQPFHRAGLAVEPMTCAPDAFNADRYDFDAGLIVLAPGAETTASWRITAF